MKKSRQIADSSAKISNQDYLVAPQKVYKPGLLRLGIKKGINKMQGFD
jgi:hypothetical protein